MLFSYLSAALDNNKKGVVLPCRTSSASQVKVYTCTIENISRHLLTAEEVGLAE